MLRITEVDEFEIGVVMLALALEVVVTGLVDTMTGGGLVLSVELAWVAVLVEAGLLLTTVVVTMLVVLVVSIEPQGIVVENCVLSTGVERRLSDIVLVMTDAVNVVVIVE